MKKRFKDQKTPLKTKLKYYLFCKDNIFVFAFKCIQTWLKMLRKHSLYHAKGSHIITGYMGKGKTLLVNCLINEVDPRKYFFLSNIKEFNQENVYYFDIDSFFDETKQKNSIPLTDEKGRKLYGIIFDEVNLKFNRRMNKTKEYNNQFVGLVEFIVSSRHQGVDRLYFIGQKLELQDSQLQSLFYYWHDCRKCVKLPSYNIFKNSGIIKTRPVKIKLLNYIKIEQNNEVAYKPIYANTFLFGLIKIKTFKFKVYYNDILTYNTTALANMYNSLPPLEIKK